MLLEREHFRLAVFKRDRAKCVFCSRAAVDAHHIIERRLFSDGGYYLDNGASVCETHHMACERTDISVEEVRAAAGIQKKVLPEHFYNDVIYDKWGNIILQNGSILAGELFWDGSVQKILKDKLHLFTPYVKYPRTMHLPWSASVPEDDRVLSSMGAFEGKRVVVTEKLDGENTSMYFDHIHARSLETEDHSSRHWVKNFWNSIRADIPEDYHVCGENMFAKHSILYESLESYFYGFSVWQKTTCLPWSETLEWFALIGITPVPVLFDGLYNESEIKKINQDYTKSEGYVIRVADAFNLRDFKNCVGKFVRAGHVQTNQHWKNRKLEKNALRS